MELALDKLKELGYELPEAPKPIAAYIPSIKSGNLLYTCGVLPILDAEVKYRGEIGGFLHSIDYGYKAAKLCAINALSIINDAIGLDNIERFIKVTGYVNSAPSFTDQPKVINGVSDLLLEVFGEKGRHVRSAVGVSQLPLGACVEVELIVEIKE